MLSLHTTSITMYYIVGATRLLISLLKITLAIFVCLNVGLKGLVTDTDLCFPELLLTVHSHHSAISNRIIYLLELPYIIG